jgi:DNA-directed RNA polymerase subunit alpha
VVGFKEEVPEIEETSSELGEGVSEITAGPQEVDTEFLKTRIESLDLSQRTVNALSHANIRTVGGLARKREDDILALEGLGQKGLQEIRRALSNYGITLK